MLAELSAPIARTLTPDTVVREVKHLPSAPKVLPRLKTLLLDGNSSLNEIVTLIRLDPGIAARVLQLGNSAFFNTGARCVTVEESVNRVGFDQVYQLVSYAVASEVLIRPLAVYELEAEALWHMSVAGALAAEVLARHTHMDEDIAYTVGLLHCVGMVALDEWSQRNATELVLPRECYPREATVAERSVFGFTQSEVGGALLHQWGFPCSISEPVRWQYAPGVTAAHLQMATLLAAAKWLRDTVCGHRPALPNTALLRPLGLSPTALAALASVVAQRMAAVHALLEEATTQTVDRDLFPSRNWKD